MREVADHKPGNDSPDEDTGAPSGVADSVDDIEVVPLETPEPDENHLASDE